MIRALGGFSGPAEIPTRGLISVMQSLGGPPRNGSVAHTHIPMARLPGPTRSQRVQDRLKPTLAKQYPKLALQLGIVDSAEGVVHPGPGSPRVRDGEVPVALAEGGYSNIYTPRLSQPQHASQKGSTVSENCPFSPSNHNYRRKPTAQHPLSLAADIHYHSYAFPPPQLRAPGRTAR